MTRKHLAIDKPMAGEIHRDPLCKRPSARVFVTDLRAVTCQDCLHQAQRLAEAKARVLIGRPEAPEDQLALAFTPPVLVEPVYPPGCTLGDRFAIWSEANPDVEAAVVRLARNLRDDFGIASCSIALLWERLRWLHRLATRGDGYKLNNSFRAHMARRIMDHHPDLVGFFETRRQPTCTTKPNPPPQPSPQAT